MSGKQTGTEYQDQFSQYLRTTSALPLSADGSVNVTELARQAEVPKQSLYKNPAIRKMLAAAIEERGLATRGQRAPEDASLVDAPAKSDTSSARSRAIEHRAHRLEQQNAALVAENAELRRQLRALHLQLGREDMVIETGRRIAIPEHRLK